MAPVEYIPCRFCGNACDDISNSCADCRRMKGRLSDKAFLAQIAKIALHIHNKRMSKVADLTLVKREHER